MDTPTQCGLAPDPSDLHDTHGVGQPAVGWLRRGWRPRRWLIRGGRHGELAHCRALSREAERPSATASEPRLGWSPRPSVLNAGGGRQCTHLEATQAAAPSRAAEAGRTARPMAARVAEALWLELLLAPLQGS